MVLLGCILILDRGQGQVQRAMFIEMAFVVCMFPLPLLGSNTEVLTGRERGVLLTVWAAGLATGVLLGLWDHRAFPPGSTPYLDHP